MRDAQNVPAVRPAFILTPQASNPVPLGSAGWWMDANGVLYWVDALGNSTAVGASGSFKQPARAATTGALAANTYDATALTLTANANGALGAIDGVTLSVGQRLLVKDEVAGANNGIYVVTSLGSGGSKYKLTRAGDFNASGDIVGGTKVAISEGTANGNKTATLTTDDPITLDTTALTFAVA